MILLYNLLAPALSCFVYGSSWLVVSTHTYACKRLFYLYISWIVFFLGGGENFYRWVTAPLATVISNCKFKNSANTRPGSDKISHRVMMLASVFHIIYFIFVPFFSLSFVLFQECKVLRFLVIFMTSMGILILMTIGRWCIDFAVYIVSNGDNCGICWVKLDWNSRYILYELCEDKK